MQIKAEMFNVFNHPNFGYIDPSLSDEFFGQSTKMLDQSFGNSGALTTRVVHGQCNFHSSSCFRFSFRLSTWANRLLGNLSCCPVLVTSGDGQMYEMPP
jgi:hypothetical protein